MRIYFPDPAQIWEANMQRILIFFIYRKNRPLDRRFEFAPTGAFHEILLSFIDLGHQPQHNDR
jgi:hypothetical protein